MELRPLGFGEIFDRAVTLYIRNFVAFAAIVVVLIVPLAIFQYVADVNMQPQIAFLLRVFTHPELARGAQVPSMFNSPGFAGIFALSALFTYAIWPFALNAVAVGVARLYRDLTVEFRACYEVALRRWPQVFGVIGIDLIVILGWYVAVMIVIIALAFFVGLFIAVAPMLAFWFGFGVGAIGLVVLFPTLAPLVVALTFAMYAVVIEERPVMEAVALGFARVFNRNEFWRALLFAIAVGAVLICGSAMFGFIGVLAALAHLPLVEAIIESLGRAVITPFGVILMAIYYFDVRIRREAFDLESTLERLAAPQPA